MSTEIAKPMMLPISPLTMLPDRAAWTTESTIEMTANATPSVQPHGASVQNP